MKRAVVGGLLWSLICVGPGLAQERDADWSPKIELTPGLVKRWMPVDPRALVSEDVELRELATLVDAGATDARILRAYWRLHLRHYPFTDAIPVDLRQRALAARDALAAASSDLSAGVCWSPLGPRNIPGRQTALVVHPTDANIIYTGGADGGIWKTTDLGANWIPLTDFQATLSIGAMAIDPRDGNVVYAGTGEGNYAGDNLPGEGVLRTTDGGANWMLLPRFTGYFHELLIDSRNSNRLLAATRAGLFQSLDRAATWTIVAGGLPAEDVTSIQQSTGNTNVFFAGVGGGFGTSPNRGFYRSVDGGATWTAIASIPVGGDNGRLMIAQSRNNPTRVYAALATTTSGGVKGIYRSGDEGLTFTAVAQPFNTCSSYCWYCLTLAADPADPNLVYVGGVSTYRSVDAGGTWTRVNNAGPNTYVHVDQHQFVTSAPGHFWSANDGGINLSTDSGTTWTHAGLTLETAQYYHFTTDPTDDTYAIGGTQDNGTHKFSGSTAFSSILGGDGAYTAIDWLDPRVYYASSQNLVMARSRDRGAGMQAIGSDISAGDPRAFIAPFALDRGNPQAMFAGTNRLWYSTNQGDNFTAIGPALATGVILSLDNCRDVPGSIWYGGSNNGQVWHSPDGGANWFDRSAGIPNRAVTSISAHPSDPAIAYLSVSGSGTGHVFKTTNSGVDWTDIAGSLPDIHMNRVLVLEDRPNTVAAAADLGIYQSDDAGLTWAVLGDQLPNVAVDWLTYSPITGTLRAGTHGRGAWQLVPANSCPLGPTFAGVEAVTIDISTCAPRLSWSPGSSNCAIAPGLSYALYRSTDPEFVAGPASLLAAGLGATTYSDLSAQPATAYFYRVRAEDGQSGRGGPNNGGQTDTNDALARIELGDATPTALFQADADPDIWLTGDGWSVTSRANATSGGRYSYQSARGGAGYHTADQCEAVITPDLELGAGAALRYSASYNLEDSWDGVVVEISTDGGMSWTDLPPAGGYPGSFAATGSPAINACGYPATQGAFSGPAGNAAPTAFQAFSSDLAGWVGQRVRIRWRLSSDPGSEFDGLFLDDVSIGPVTPTPASSPVGNVLKVVKGSAVLRFSFTHTVASATAYRLVHAPDRGFVVADTVAITPVSTPLIIDATSRTGATHFFRIHSLIDCIDRGP